MEKYAKFSVVDMFKSATEERPKIRYQEDYTRGNVWAKNGIGASVSNTHKQEPEKPLKTLMESGLNKCLVITENGDLEISIAAANRIQKIQDLEYVNCTKVEATDKAGYEGYRIYNLYRHSFVANRDLIEYTIAVK